MGVIDLFFVGCLFVAFTLLSVRDSGTAKQSVATAHNESPNKK